MIDHELSFNLNGKTFRELFQDWEKYWSFIKAEGKRRHLFFDFLQEKNKNSTVQFETFAEYLRTLRVDILDRYAQQLKSSDNDVNDYDSIKEYLINVKEEQKLFIQLLKKLIA